MSCAACRETENLPEDTARKFYECTCGQKHVRNSKGVWTTNGGNSWTVTPPKKVKTYGEARTP